ncbi:MAG: LLM class flavin-dependent oxidoreductase [Solirubrobacteraceae bacterium]
MLEIGTWIVPAPTRDAEETAEVERLGFDVALYGESQTVFEDPYVRMAFAAAKTSRIVVAPGVGVTATRDASVLAACVAAVHAESGGRARLCLGSGDSALAATGRPAPLPLAEFAREINLVRGYLHGEELDRNGTSSRLHWLPKDLPAVEVDITATGPRTIATAAKIADRVTFNVGASLDRVEWATGIAREARRSTPVGAWITVAVGNDERELIDRIRAVCAVHARFPATKGGDTSVLQPHARAVAESVNAELARPSNETRLTTLRRAAALVDDEYVRWYAIVGTPSEVAARLHALIDVGLRHLYLVFGDPNTNQGFMRASRLRFVKEVMPALRSAQMRARPSG